MSSRSPGAASRQDTYAAPARETLRVTRLNTIGDIFLARSRNLRQLVVNNGDVQVSLFLGISVFYLSPLIHRHAPADFSVPHSLDTGLCGQTFTLPPITHACHRVMHGVFYETPSSLDSPRRVVWRTYQEPSTLRKHHAHFILLSFINIQLFVLTLTCLI